MLVETLIASLKKHCGVGKNEKMLLAFSGGPDSVCLLDILAREGYELILAHFNHKLREESDSEASFAKNTAELYKLQYFSGSMDVRRYASENKIGIEAAARACRYLFLSEIAKKNGAKYVLTAHHADDQVETILMNIFRGSGLNGLTGMPYRAMSEFGEPITILRPMIKVWKKEILDYCENRGLSYLIDATNLETEFARNKLRNVIIPLIEEDYAGLRKNVIRMREILEADNEKLDELAQSQLHKTIPAIREKFFQINREYYSELPTSLQRRTLLMAIEQAYGTLKDITFQMVEDIRGILLGSTGSGFALISEKMQVLVENNTGNVFQHPDQLKNEMDLVLAPENENEALIIPGVTPINATWSVHTVKMVEKKIDAERYLNAEPFTAYFDAEKLEGNLVLQISSEGRRYAPLGMDGSSMKLSDFFINNKIPKRLRRRYPLLSDGERVVWVPGFQPSHHTRITAQTKHVIQAELKTRFPKFDPGLTAPVSS